MAESIHTIIKNKAFTVNHQGMDLTTGISNFFDRIDKLTSLEEIKTWLAEKSTDEQLAFYHYGFDSAIIKNRAVCRPVMKTYAKKIDFETAKGLLDDLGDYHISENKQTITMNIMLDPAAEDRAENWTPKPKAVPGSSKKPVTIDKALELANSLSPEALTEMIAKMQALQAKG